MGVPDIIHFDRYTLFSESTDHAEKDLMKFNDRLSAVSFLREFATDPSTMQTFREVLCGNQLGHNLFRMTNHEVIERLSWELVSGTLKIAAGWLERERRGGITVGRAPADRASQKAEQPRAAVEEKTWIEIKLIDESDQPVANEKFEIVFPDGSRKKGATNSYGMARFTGIESGECKIVFVDLDPNAWDMV